MTALAVLGLALALYGSYFSAALYSPKTVS